MAVRAANHVVANPERSTPTDGDVRSILYGPTFEDFFDEDKLNTKTGETLNTLIGKIMEGENIDRSSTNTGLKNQGLEMIFNKMQRSTGDWDVAKEKTRDMYNALMKVTEQPEFLLWKANNTDVKAKKAAKAA